jgi:hypothetical protein
VEIQMIRVLGGGQTAEISAFGFFKYLETNQIWKMSTLPHLGTNPSDTNRLWWITVDLCQSITGQSHLDA